MSAAGRRFQALLVAAVALAAPTEARTRFHEVEAAELAEGRAEGIAVSSRGRLFLAPGLARLDGEEHAAAQTWSLASDRSGRLFVGTGPQGAVLRLSGSSGPRPFFAVEQPLVASLALGPQGRLLAGTAPDGLVYRAEASGAGTSGEIWSETGERYVWALALGADGRVYAGTGESGRVLRLKPSGEAQVIFDSDEAHIVSLVALPDGDLLAGGAGRGLVYRVDPEGHAFVLYDSDLPEVADLALGPDGAIFAALLGPPRVESGPPELRIKVPETPSLEGPGQGVAALDRTTLRGVIQGIGRGTEPRSDPRRGSIVRIDADGSVTELWSSKSQAPFALTLDRQGRVVFGTGEPARLYRLEAGNDVARLATLREAQVTALHDSGKRLYVATSNPTAFYVLDEEAGESGVFSSSPIDAGGPARWGSIRWRREHPSGRTELYTRTGNSRDPDATWSAWSPALTDAEGSPIVNPEGRFLQWRLRQVGGGGSGRISDVGVAFEPYNRPPEIRDFRIDGRRSAVSGTVDLRWSARDPDGDPVQVTIEVRRQGAETFAEAGVFRPRPRLTGPDADWRPARWSWETEEIEQGSYELRALATDQPSNAPDEGRIADEPRRLRVVVDRTPPEITISPQGPDLFEVLVSDVHGRIARLEVLRDGHVHFVARPIDGLCDAGLERYRLELGEEGDWSLRGVDAAENVTERPVRAE